MSGQVQEMPFLPQLPHDPPVNPYAGMGHQDQDSQDGGQKLDTVDDLISVLQNNVKGKESQYELVPVNPNDVLPNSHEVLVKDEPADSGYEQQGLFPLVLDTDGIEVKQETDVRLAPRTLGQWSSTAEQIRAGMDTLTQQDDPSPSSAHIQNIVQFLEHDDQFTVTVTDPKTSRVVEQTTARTVPLQMSGGNVRQLVTSDLVQPLTYVMSSASMGSLGICSTGQSKVNGVGAQPTGVSTGSAMQNVKLRVNPTTPRSIPTPGVMGSKPGVNARQVAMTSQVRGHTTPASRTMAASLNGGAVQTSPATRFQSAATQPGNARPVDAASRLQLARMQQAASANVAMTTSHNTLSAADMAAIQLSSDNLMSTSTRLIHDYLNNHSIENMQQ